MGSAAWLMGALEAWAPLHWADEWDNVGLLLGDAAPPVRRALVALDATEAVVQEAVRGGYDFLITHHPLIFDPLKKITADTVTGRKVIALLAGRIRLYCAHTNLDKASGGVNDCLFNKLNLQNPSVLIEEESGAPGLGLVGELPAPLKLAAFVRYIKEALQLPCIRYAGESGALIATVGLCGGDASHPRYWKAALEKNCQAFITGDLRYHGTQEALEAGIALVDISHYAGEIGIVEAIVSRLRRCADNDGIDIIIEATQTDGQVFCKL